jgi:hypothetical protein
MWFRDLLDSLKPLATRAPARRTRRPTVLHRCRPGLECLEDRVTPATILVDTFADVVNPNDGLTSLREAIALAADPASHPGEDNIVLPHEIGGVARPYGLTLGQLTIDDPTGKLTIASVGDLTTIYPQVATRVFGVEFGTEAEFIGLNIAGGQSFSEGEDGLGRWTGGGIANGGTLTVRYSTLSHNYAGTRGGGIWNSGTLTVTASTLSDNTADFDGGGIWNRGTLTVTASTLSDNSAASYDGGGIWNRGTLTVTGSDLNDNSADNGGGGIWNELGTLMECSPFFGPREMTVSRTTDLR